MLSNRMSSILLNGMRYANIGRRSNQIISRFCSTSKDMASSSKTQTSFLELAQVDKGFYQGTALLVGACAFGMFAPTNLQSSILVKTVDMFRALGLSKEHVSDKQLLEDFIKKNILAAQNVILASPSFYFMWHLIHGSSLKITLARSITGTMRIVPFMGIFYGGFALIAPWVTSIFIGKGQSYKEAQGNAGMALMLSGFAVLEAVVELRGCGVPFSAMSLTAFAIFIPALIGRLVAGVLTQQQKVGEESEYVLPLEWETSDDEMKKKAFAWCKTLAIDKDFFTTVIGTSIFQHVLNGVTYVLLNKGKANVLRDFTKYLSGGLSGTFGGSLNLFARTLALRSFFCWTWNFCSSQSRDVSPVDAAIQELERKYIVS